MNLQKQNLLTQLKIKDDKYNFNDGFLVDYIYENYYKFSPFEKQIILNKIISNNYVNYILSNYILDNYDNKTNPKIFNDHQILKKFINKSFLIFNIVVCRILLDEWNIIYDENNKIIYENSFIKNQTLNKVLYNYLNNIINFFKSNILNYLIKVKIKEKKHGNLQIINIIFIKI